MAEPDVHQAPGEEEWRPPTKLGPEPDSDDARDDGGQHYELPNVGGVY